MGIDPVNCYIYLIKNNYYPLNSITVPWAMIRKLFKFVLVPGCLVMAGVVDAHHSAGLLYDQGKVVEVSGTVTGYEFGNPHLRIYFNVDNNGRTENWLAEGGSRTVLIRKGWDGTEVKAGDVITIRGNPSRDGSNIIHVLFLMLPDGRQLYAEDLDPKQLERRRRQRN